MNCPKCGTPIPQDAAFCPVCNEPLSAYVQPGYMPGYAQGMPQGYPPPGPGVGVQPPMSGAQGMQPPPAAQQPYMGAQQQPYPQQQNLYRQSYAQYQQGTYPPGFQQPYSYGQPAAREANPLLTALSALPRTFLDSFTRAPGGAARHAGKAGSAHRPHRGGTDAAAHIPVRHGGDAQLCGRAAFGHFGPDRSQPGQRCRLHESGHQLYRRAHRSVGGRGGGAVPAHRHGGAGSGVSGLPLRGRQGAFSWELLLGLWR